MAIATNVWVRNACLRPRISQNEVDNETSSSRGRKCPGIVGTNKKFSNRDYYIFHFPTSYRAATQINCILIFKGKSLNALQFNFTLEVILFTY